MENQSPDKKVFLLDALALIFRAYYALIRNPRITSKGKNTNAQFGFINTLLDLINNQKPTHMAVCFDTQAPTERHTEFSDYKANRQDAPEDLLAAIPDIKKIIRGFNIPVLEVDGFEADDVIGTLSKKGSAAGFQVFMVTPDKDYGQLVDGNVKIYKPGYQGGDAEILGAKEVCEKWNIKEVHQVIDILGLMGDAVDNIPGIAGVGEKTAAKLLNEYGTLENVLENADKIKGALGEKVRNGKNAAILSKKLATIITDVPIEFHEEDFRLKEWNRDLLKEVFIDLEFKTVAKRILGEEISIVPGAIAAPQGVQTDLFGNAIESPKATKTQKAEAAGDEDRALDGDIMPAGKNIHNTAHQYRTIQEEDALKTLVKELLEEKEICFDTETTGIDANDVELVGMSFSYKVGEA
ncbi:MAG TPA: 5'-3' exonuclease H3TH domain-containing protein, partial [Niastella sp.]